MKNIICIFILLANCGVLTAQKNVFGENTVQISIANLKWFKTITSPSFGIFEPNTPTDVGVIKSESQRERSPFPPGGSLKTVFVYRVEFKNETGKKIKGIVWDYIFSDSNNEELERHEFYYPFKIGKNKTAKVENTSFLPPTQSVKIEDLGKDRRSSYIERAEIKCVVFDDNTMWKKAETEEKTCEKMRNFLWQREQRLRNLRY